VGGEKTIGSETITISQTTTKTYNEEGGGDENSCAIQLSSRSQALYQSRKIKRGEPGQTIFMDKKGLDDVQMEYLDAIALDENAGKTREKCDSNVSAKEKLVKGGENARRTSPL